MSIHHGLGLDNAERNAYLRTLSDSLERRVEIAESELEEMKKNNKTATHHSFVALLLSAGSLLLSILALLHSTGVLTKIIALLR